jgi:HSP20 family molecular chaperone IbpA
MMMPSTNTFRHVFGEDLFDELMDFPFERNFRDPVFGKHEKNLMKTDVKEHDGHYELDMDLPGYKKEEVTAKLENGYLTISASRDTNHDQKDEAGNYIRQERYIGSCERSFYIGDGVKQEDIKASFDNGILHLEIPKAAPKAIEEDNNYIMIS